MSKFFFTYGTGGHDFYGGWTEVEAETCSEACGAFRAYHPDVNAGVLNCCSVYYEDAFKRTKMYTDGNFGRRCHETISIRRTMCGEVEDEL